MTRKNPLATVRWRRSAAARQLAGFTLIELMVAMVIGLFLVLAMTTLLINVSRNNSEMSKTNGLIENGRFALQLLEDEVSHAGFLGGYVPEFDNLAVPDEAADNPYIPTVEGSYPSSTVPDPCRPFFPPAPPPAPPAGWPDSMKKSLIGIPVQGYEIPAAVPSPVLPVCASVVTDPKANTDVLFVRHLERAANCLPDPATGSTPSGCPVPVDNGVYFQQSRCGESMVPQGTDPDTSAYVFQGYLPDPALPTAGNATFLLRQRNCSTLAELRKFVSSLYYVRDYAVRAGDGIPTLMRSQFGPVTTSSGQVMFTFQPAQPMIEGIEGFRVEYGIDSLSDFGAAVNFAEPIRWANAETKTSPINRGDGLPDGAYVRCTAAAPCNVDQMVNTVAVRIYVLARSLEPTPGYEDKKTYNLGSTTFTPPAGDSYKRHLFVQTIRLHNVSSRRETP